MDITKTFVFRDFAFLRRQALCEFTIRILLPISSNFGRGSGNKGINFIEEKWTTGQRRKFSGTCTEDIFAVGLHPIINIRKSTRNRDNVYGLKISKTFR